MLIKEEQYITIGKALGWGVSYQLEHGIAAVQECAPILLAEPSEEEWRAIVREGRGMYGTPFTLAVCRLLIAARLRSVLAKPDPAVEAVSKELPGLHPAVYPRIVAAVDAARAGQKEGE